MLLVLVSAPAEATDGIHWTFTGPTSVTVDWRGPDSTLRYGFTRFYTRTVVGRRPEPYPVSSEGPFWEARLDGLLPATVYHYSVAGGPDHVFHTPPRPGASFTVYVQADVGAGADYVRVPAVQELIASGRPAFVLVPGDLTYADDNGPAAVDNHFNDVMVWSQDAAYMPTWGNHEWGSSNDDLRNYKGRFGLPNAYASPGAPSRGCCGEDWYWFDYAHVRFIAYPEPYTGDTWPEWAEHADSLMDAAEADARIRFIVTFGHRPAYSSGHHGGSQTLRDILDRLGDEHRKYVLNLNGHSHNYERSYRQNGVMHVTVGTGGSTLEPDGGDCLWAGGCPPPPWSAFRAMRHGALRLEFRSESILGKAMCGPPGLPGTNDLECAYGEVFDLFALGSELPPIVDAPEHASAPIVDVPDHASVCATAMLELEVTAHDPDGEPVRQLTADLSELPEGHGARFLAGANQARGVLTWIPEPGDTGTYTVRFRAVSELATSDSTLLTVLAPSPPPAGTRLTLERLSSNPAVSRLRASYWLSAEAPARLELLNVAGRVVWRRDLGSPGPGRHDVEVRREAGWRSGLYWLRLEQAGETATLPVVFIR